MKISSMKIIDTHAHLATPEFGKDLSEVLERAKNAGVKAIVTVSESMEDAKKALELAQRFSMVHAGAGLFPTVTDLDEANALYSFIRKNRDRLCCIGEVGLDYWRVQDAQGRERQKEIMRGFVRLSLELGLPLNCHSRSAGRHIIDLLMDEGAEKVQLHAFDGKASTALKGQEQGYLFSIPPSVVRSRQKQKLVKALSISSLLIETDSPVLGPEPKMRNEPSNAALVIEAIATIKGIAVEEVEENIWENTKRLYGSLTQG